MELVLGVPHGRGGQGRLHAEGIEETNDLPGRTVTQKSNRWFREQQAS